MKPASASTSVSCNFKEPSPIHYISSSVARLWLCMHAPLTRKLLRRYPRVFCCGTALFAVLSLLVVTSRPRRLDVGDIRRTDQQLLLQHYDARQLLFRRGGRRVLFLHIHKAAGSTVCQLAIDAGELVNRESNCNLDGAAKRGLAAGTAGEQCTALRSAS